jgi:hypothetical protein
MFKEVSIKEIEKFRLIYHQTTGYSNPIIESALYQNKGGEAIFYWDEMSLGNYIIFHRSGFGHINFNLHHNSKSPAEIDEFLVTNSKMPQFVLLYNTPDSLKEYWKEQSKPYFKIRKRRRYLLNEDSFNRLDKSLYEIPKNHKLVMIQECPIVDLELFEMNLDSKFYNSYQDFFENSFGHVLYNEKNKPACIAYLICNVGGKTECDLKTLAEHKEKGYGYITITQYVADSFRRQTDVGWDCFVENHTNKWAQQYGYHNIIREYDFVSFLNIKHSKLL